MCVYIYIYIYTHTHTYIYIYIYKLWPNNYTIMYLLSDLKTHIQGASPVAQWLRICLPMQGTRVQALVWEDPTCRRATEPMSHNY